MAKTIQALAKQLGATIKVHRDRENLEHEITADAPTGMVWACASVHQLICSGADGTTMAQLRTDMLDRMSHGVAPCDDEECDVCQEDNETFKRRVAREALVTITLRDLADHQHGRSKAVRSLHAYDLQFADLGRLFCHRCLASKTSTDVVAGRCTQCGAA